MKASEFIEYDAIGLGEMVASRQVTAVELAQTSISIIEALNPVLNAVICKDYERALHSVTRPLAGPLAGAPFLLKDVYLQSDGMPTTYGSRYLMGTRSRPDSIMVERWREAGLSILGKTNTPEFAARFVTEPVAYGKTVNPWDPHTTVGGSSGGAAAAVASGMVPLAHATDSAGSIRVPAACCGLYGFKPTAGLNTVGPYFEEIAHGLNSDHVLTRSVRDSAASLDATANRSEATSYLRGSSATPGKLKVAVTVHAANGRAAGTNQVAAVEKTIEMLRELGHEVTLLARSPLLEIGAWSDLLWIDDIPALIAQRQAETGVRPGEDDLEPRTWGLLRVLKDHSAEDLDEAIRRKEQAAKAYLSLFDSYDLLLAPSLATDPAPPEASGNQEAADSWAEACAAFSIMANVSGQPAASLPLPLAGCAIPVGVQIMAAPHRDLLILQISRQLEPMFDWAAAHREHWRSLKARLPFPAN